MNSNWSYSPKVSIEVKISNLFIPCDLEIWRMTDKNNWAQLLCCFKFCASFHSHQWIQTGVTVRELPICLKIDDVCRMWPWNSMDDLRKQYPTPSILHQASCIISKAWLNSNSSYSSVTPDLAQKWWFIVAWDLESCGLPWRTLGHFFYATPGF